MDVEALNNQVEERKLQETTERSKEAAYGKKPKAGGQPGGKSKDLSGLRQGSSALECSLRSGGCGKTNQTGLWEQWLC